MSDKDKPVDTIEYRGIKVPIYLDDAAQQYYTVLDGEEFGFGSFNADFTSDLKYLIDRKLDLIHEFEDFSGAKLEWFDNGYNFRDIRLIYRSRTLKVFLIRASAEIDENSIINLIKDCEESLKNYIKIYN